MNSKTLAAGAAVIALLATGCSSNDTSSTSTTTASATTATTNTATGDASEGATEGSATVGEAGSAVTITGTTGSATASVAAEGQAPEVSVEAPLTVAETTTEVLKEGDGDVVPENATVLVKYHGVNGRDNKVFDSSYKSEEPVEFPLNGVIPGFAKAIAGQKVGSHLLTAMTAEDGYPNGSGSAIKPGDNLVFYIEIVSTK